MMLHPAYEILLMNGIAPEYVKQSPVDMVNGIVTILNESGTSGVVAYSEWATVRVFFDSLHVCNIHIDDNGLSFEYDRKGPMFSDQRANTVIYSVIQAVSQQK